MQILIKQSAFYKIEITQFNFHLRKLVLPMDSQFIQTSRLPSCKKPTKLYLGKLLTQRKSAQNIQQTQNTSKGYNLKVNAVQTTRQNPITFIQSIQNEHNLAQTTLQQSHLTSSKWRSYNSPVDTPIKINKQNSLLESIYKEKKQLSAIKVFNHVHNREKIATNNFQQPHFVQFVQQAVAKSTMNTFRHKEKVGESLFSLKRSSKVKKIDPKQTYTAGENRKQLQNLQNWIKQKVQTYEHTQKNGQSMIIQRINFLNMAFSQISRICGTFSTQSKNIIEYLHKKYYEYYNFLMECMIEQNKQIKSEISIVQDRLFNTINHYEQKLEKIKVQHGQKSHKIISNFHKCIEVKKKLESDTKELDRNLTNQKKKVKLMEEGLIKVITLFLALGQKNIQEMTFTLNNTQEEAINMSVLAKSKKHILTEQQRQIERKKSIFQQWCGYLIKMIHKIVMKDISRGKNQKQSSPTYFRSQALQIIQTYMVQNDDSLSMKDAQKILLNFISSQQEEKKMKQELKDANQNEGKQCQNELRNLELLNNKFQNMYNDISYQLPTFKEVYKKSLVKDADIQVNIKDLKENCGVQTFIETIQTGITAAPRVKNKQIDASSHLKQNIRLQSCIYSFNQIYKAKIQKELKNIKKIEERVRTQMQKIQSHPKTIQHLLLEKPSQSQKLQYEHLVHKKKSQKQPSLNNYIDIPSTDSLTRQVGVNTVMSRVQNKKRTVEFSIPQTELAAQNNVDTLTSDDLQNEKSLLSPSGSQNQFLKIQSQQINDSVKQFDSKSDIKSIDGQVKKFRGRRKNGFMITGDRKRTHLSHKFIQNHSQTSIASQSSGDENIDIQPCASKKKETSLSIQVQGDNRISLQKNVEFQKASKRKNHYQTFQQKLSFNRSFFNLSNVEYLTKQQADTNRIKDHVIRVPKKKTYREKFLIDSYDLHLQLAFKNHEKLKFLSTITLWHPKIMVQMKKIRRRVQKIKALPIVNNETMHLIKGYFLHFVNPILKDLLKSYCQQLNSGMYDFGDSLMNSSFKGFKNLSLQKKMSESSNGFEKNKNTANILTYYHRLSPLLYNIINFTQYNQNKTSTDNEVYFSGMKTLRSQTTKMEVYSLLMEGSCVEIDIFIKAIYHFNLTISSNISYDPQLSYFILETTVTQILEGYFTANEVKKIVEETKSFIINSQDGHNSHRRSSLKSDFKKQTAKNTSNQNKLLSSDAKITFFDLLRIIFTTLRQKQQIQLKKYAVVSQIISRNAESTSYQDIMHFLNCLPIQNDKRRKILNQSLKHTIYWQKSQPTVPNDVLFFIFDKNELYASNINTQNNSVIQEYIVNRCQLYFKGTLQKVTKSPEWVLNSTYILSYKIPKLFHRILSQIKTGRNIKQKKLLLCLLTQIFCNMIDTQMDKRYMPSLFNGLLSIPNY